MSKFVAKHASPSYSLIPAVSYQLSIICIHIQIHSNFFTVGNATIIVCTKLTLHWQKTEPKLSLFFGLKTGRHGCWYSVGMFDVNRKCTLCNNKLECGLMMQYFTIFCQCCLSASEVLPSISDTGIPATPLLRSPQGTCF